MPKSRTKKVLKQKPASFADCYSRDGGILVVLRNNDLDELGEKFLSWKQIGRLAFPQLKR